jgi:hypothetical protein
MGFTRYYTVNRKLDPEKFKHFSNACQLVCEKIQKKENYELADWDGTKGTAPVFSDTEVRFNGVEDDSHETFSISVHKTGFEFTKTNRKPYDSSVSACLYLARHFFGTDIKVSDDDGGEDYNEIRSLVTDIIRDEKINILVNVH